MHKACRPTDHEDDDECVLCGDENCQINDISCRTGCICQHRNCRNNAVFFHSIYINFYDTSGHRIIGGGVVEADAVLTCAKCVISDVSVEMEKLLFGADISTPLELLFCGYIIVIRFNTYPKGYNIHCLLYPN